MRREGRGGEGETTRRQWIVNKSKQKGYRTQVLKSSWGMVSDFYISWLRLWGSPQWTTESKSGQKVPKIFSLQGTGWQMGGEGPVGWSSCDLTYPMPAMHKQQSCKSLLSAGTGNGSPYKSKSYRSPALPTRQVLALDWHFSSSQPAAVVLWGHKAGECQQQTAVVLSVTEAALQGGYLLALLTPYQERTSNKEAWCLLPWTTSNINSPVCQSTYGTLCF